MWIREVVSAFLNLTLETFKGSPIPPNSNALETPPPQNDDQVKTAATVAKEGFGTTFARTSKGTLWTCVKSFLGEFLIDRKNWGGNGVRLPPLDDPPESILIPLFPSTLFPHPLVSAKTRALQGRSSRYKPRPCRSLPSQSYVASPSKSFSRHWLLPRSANGSRTWH